MADKLINTSLLDVLSGRLPKRTPVWIMRQAGRYLSEYRAVRKTAGSFIDLYKSPDLACEVTLQPLQRFDLDAAILFSDILTIPEALGLGLDFVEGHGPQFTHKIESLSDILALPQLQVGEDLHYVFETIKLLKQELSGAVPLIGFTGSPWTLATYMLQGGAAKEFTAIRKLMFADPDALHTLLSKLTDIIKHYVTEQVNAGADVIQIFDTWGNLLNPADYQEFSLKYMQEIIHYLSTHVVNKQVPTTIFTKNTSNYLTSLSASEANCIGIDWTTDLKNARNLLGNKVIQGNLDPAILLGNTHGIVSNLQKIKQVKNLKDKGYIFNLGHGIYPQTDPANVKFLVDYVHEHL